MPVTLDLSECLNRAADQHPRRIFLKTPEGRECTYQDLSAQVASFGAALAQLEVLAGDRVLVQVEKSVEAVYLYAACLAVGAVFVPINPANTAAEMHHFLNDARPKLAVLDPAKLSSLQAIARAAGALHVETLSEAGTGTLIDRVRRTASAALEASHAAESLAAILYTSGTTGKPKGAMLTRANLAANAWALAQLWRFTSRDVLMHVLPLFHIHGLFVAINTVWVSGASILLLPKFDAAEALRRMHGATVFMGVPTHYTRLLQQAALDRSSTAAMRLFVSGSAPLPAETHREFARRTGHAILERYGMSETLINTSNPYEGERIPGSVGPPLPDTGLRIAGAGSENPVGAIEVKGPGVFAGYWQDPAKTRAEFTSDGWFKTGDVGRIQDGYVYIVGRAKDLVISGGFNVYPKEVETEIDAIEGVLESAVFAVPHPDFGEGVTAAVIPKLGAILAEREIIERVQQRLARYKVPKRVLILSELPRNAMGKVQKNELRRTFARLYQPKS